MSKLSKNVAYLKGLADGLKLAAETPESELLLSIVEALEEFSEEYDELIARIDQLDDYIGVLDADLSMVEDIFEEIVDSFPESHCDMMHDDFDEGDDIEDGIVEYECPHCGYLTHFEVCDFDLEEDYRCPSCHQPLFPDSDEEYEDDDFDEDDEENEDGEE
ncbi:MAG TPA: hypothetical protein GXZ91_00975 [Christensenellaceae bacterium]|nr:hypothetical protein [Christensenellaceae bacterium]